MNRRQLLQGILGAALAPAFVKATNLMPVRSMPSGLVVWGDGVIDDTAALQAYINGERVTFAKQLRRMARGGLLIEFPHGKYRITDTLQFGNADNTRLDGGWALFALDSQESKPALQIDSFADGRIEHFQVSAPNLGMRLGRVSAPSAALA